jgi:nicotinamidase-related amidase
MNTALLLIDIQNDYFPGGRMELEAPLLAAQQAGRLLDFFRRQGWPTVHIQHISNRPGATFFLPDTDGLDFHEAIRPLVGEKVIVKHFPNSFRETGLLEHLQGSGIEALVICGMMTHMCVDATTRAAADLGYPIRLAVDACATRTLAYGETQVPAQHVQAAFLVALKSYGQVLGTEEILKQLEGSSAGETA